MARRSTRTYRPKDFGEEALLKEFTQQRDDARSYFLNQIRPRLDRSYKLFVAYNGDRAKEIQQWQANIFVPYTQAVVETLMPRILDARPDFTVQGRTEADDLKAKKVQYLADYFWEVAGMDGKAEQFVRSALIYGTAFLQVSWKKDVREQKFLKTTDISKKPVWKKEKKVFYDAPYAEWVDNYNIWYDWRHVEAKEKRFWFKRLVINKAEIERRYPMADKAKLEMIRPGGDITDYGQVRREVKSLHESISKGKDFVTANTGTGTPYYYDNEDELYEVFEWWRPYDDKYAVMANDTPILKGGEMPNPYEFKETPFIPVHYLKVPGEFEGYGLPIILEGPQILLNTIKNQRIDAVTLNIHKMWVVNPLANIDKSELVTRPFGIIYSPDPQGVREIQFSDVKQSAYQEENLLKNDMRYASGVDDFSMGAQGQAGSATEVRHLRESTIERVRLFVNHLGEAFSTMQRYWLSMTRQFFTEKMILRITGEEGQIEYPLIEKDDLMGEFDFRATVLPSIAGQQEIKKKQDMDLLQVLMPFLQPGPGGFIDAQKLIAKLLYDWDFDYNAIAKNPQEMMQQQGMQPGMEGQPMQPGGMGMEGQPPMPLPGAAGPTPGPGGPRGSNNEVDPQVIAQALSLIGGSPIRSAILNSPFAEAGAPIPLVPGQVPPTAPSIPGPQTSNPRGMNRGGRVNTNIATGNKNTNPEAQLMNRTFNIQR